MGFRLIKGSFAPRLGIPDGDSVRFIPDDESLLKGLKGRSIQIYANKEARSVQLRYEGVDTMEKTAAKPWSVDATERNLALIGGPGKPNQVDSRGYILTRRGGKNRRPISFVYAGEPSEPDGADVFLDTTRVQRSVNYELLREGHGYPMFYNTLFADLRDVLAAAARQARSRKRGVWGNDGTNTGVSFAGRASLGTMRPVFPKLWRRLRAWARQRDSLDGFKDWLAERDEWMEVISTAHEGQFEDVVSVRNGCVWITESPENLKFR